MKTLIVNKNSLFNKGLAMWYGDPHNFWEDLDFCRYCWRVFWFIFWTSFIAAVMTVGALTTGYKFLVTLCGLHFTSGVWLGVASFSTGVVILAVALAVVLGICWVITQLINWYDRRKYARLHGKSIQADTPKTALSLFIESVRTKTCFKLNVIEKE